jgi:hypothetical protein
MRQAAALDLACFSRNKEKGESTVVLNLFTVAAFPSLGLSTPAEQHPVEVL